MVVDVASSYRMQYGNHSPLSWPVRRVLSRQTLSARVRSQLSTERTTFNIEDRVVPTPGVELEAIQKRLSQQLQEKHSVLSNNISRQRQELTALRSRLESLPQHKDNPTMLLHLTILQKLEMKRASQEKVFHDVNKSYMAKRHEQRSSSTATCQRSVSAALSTPPSEGGRTAQPTACQYTPQTSLHHPATESPPAPEPTNRPEFNVTPNASSNFKPMSTVRFKPNGAMEAFGSDHSLIDGNSMCSKSGFQAPDSFTTKQKHGQLDMLPDVRAPEQHADRSSILSALHYKEIPNVNLSLDVATDRHSSYHFSMPPPGCETGGCVEGRPPLPDGTHCFSSPAAYSRNHLSEQTLVQPDGRISQRAQQMTCRQNANHHTPLATVSQQPDGLDHVTIALPCSESSAEVQSLLADSVLGLDSEELSQYMGPTSSSWLIHHKPFYPASHHNLTAPMPSSQVVLPRDSAHIERHAMGEDIFRW